MAAPLLYLEGSEHGQRVVTDQPGDESWPDTVSHGEQMVSVRMQHRHTELQHIQDLGRRGRSRCCSSRHSADAQHHAREPGEGF